ncbi:MAG TPA: hypothetical protein VEY88_24510, partial [Archangium sp.]|nr:hypothetical protein [Archangium sp.]
MGTSSQPQQVVVSNSSTAFNITSITFPTGFQVTAPTPVPTNGSNPVAVPAATTANNTTTNGIRTISVVLSPTQEGTPSG